MQRAVIVQQQAAQLQLVSDSTFLVFGPGRDLRSIMMNFELALQISVSYWHSNLTPLNHFMTGLSDTMDVLSGGVMAKIFKAIIGLATPLQLTSLQLLPYCRRK